MTYPIKQAAEFLTAKKYDDLTVRQLLLLFFLRDGAKTVRAAAESIGIQKAAITRATDKLAALGWVVRKPDPDDQRSVLIDLTSQGRKFIGHFE